MQSMSMLVETSHAIETLHENTAKGSHLYIEGIFGEAELKNGNGRWYPLDVLESAVMQYNQDFISKRRAIGELNHPDYPLPNIKEAAILIESLTMQGTKAIGKARVLDTPQGNLIRGLIDGGFNMGVSTRGLGSIKERNGLKYVEEGYMLTAVDCVDMPSGPNCYVNPIRESLSKWIMKDGNLVQLEESNEIILPQDQIIESILDFIKKL
jgi:hypothetical protein